MGVLGHCWGLGGKGRREHGSGGFSSQRSFIRAMIGWVWGRGKGIKSKTL